MARRLEADVRCPALSSLRPGVDCPCRGRARRRLPRTLFFGGGHDFGLRLFQPLVDSAHSGYAFSEKENIDAFEKAIPPEFRDFEHFINSGVGKIPLLVNLWESGYFLLLEGIIRRHYALFMDDLVAIVSLPMFQARAKLLLFLLEKMPVVPFRDILEDILKAIEPSNPPTNECAPSASGEFDNLKKWIHHNIGRDSLRSLPGGAGQAGIGPSIDPKLP